MALTFMDMIEQARERVDEIAIEQVRAWIEAREPFVLVDVREDSEWERGRIPGSVHLGRGVLERDAPKVLPEAAAHVVVYCAGGARSVLAADVLQQLGYRRVQSMVGGFSAWREMGLPVEGAGG